MTSIYDCFRNLEETSDNLGIHSQSMYMLSDQD